MALGGLLFAAVIILNKSFSGESFKKGGIFRVLVVLVIFLELFLQSLFGTNFNDITLYSYKSEISEFSLSNYRIAETYEKKLKRSHKEAYGEELKDGEYTINVTHRDNNVITVSTIFYGGISIGIFLASLRKIESHNLEYEVKVKKRRALYERRWYDKWF